MQFAKLNEFRPPPAKEVKTSFLNDKKSNKIEKPKIICAAFSASEQILTCGLSDGSIIQFMNQKYSNKKLTESKDYEVRNYNTLPNIHKGQIRCLLSQTIFNQLFVITGSADRTIKIWDTQPKSKSVVQTLTGHTGTVICLTYSKKSDTLFSGSNDKSIRIWKQDEGRKFFMYPWYICYQVLLDFSPKKMDKPIYPTSFQIHDGQISNFILYVGDSAGNLHIIREYEIEGMIEESQGKSKTGFQIDRSNYSHHRLNINSIVYIPKEHLVVTCGYDQYIYGFESLSQKLTLKYANPKKCIFTSVIWVQNLIVAADEQGNFYCLQLSSDKGIEEIKKYNKCINQIFVSRGQIFTVTDDGVDVFRIIRGIKTVQGQNCHTDSILRLYSLQAYRLTDKKIKDQVKIVSVSLDNTMRVWDPNDLTCLQVLQNPQKAQISSLFYLKRANLFVTGHENGMVRLWNIELQTSITVSQQNSTFAHNNTVCSFAEYIHIRGKEDITEYLFSTGYQGKINVWQIFLKKSSVQSSLISSSICPQLKYSFFPQEQQESPDKIGFELFALQIWENKSKGSQQNDISILSAGSKGYVYFTWMFTYQTYKKMKIHNDSINCLLIDQNILFTGSYDNTIKLTLLETMQFLSVLSVHESALTRMEIIEETGHLMSQSCEGQIIFWDYPEQRAVKKIKEKKQNINCSCYVDESQMMYVGTEDAKILTFSLADIYQKPVNKSTIFKKKVEQEDEISEESLKNMMERNEEMLRKLKGP